MIRLLVAMLFALGMLGGIAFANEHAPAEAEPPAEQAEGAEAEGDDFLDALTANPELSAFANAFGMAGVALDPMLQYTVFALADSVVFEPTALGTPDGLSTYIVQGAFTRDQLWEMAEAEGGSTTLTTIDNREIVVEIVDDQLMVAGVAQITTQDIEVANGFIHVVDATFDAEPAAPAGG